jgi:hypothetical protein
MQLVVVVVFGVVVVVVLGTVVGGAGLVVGVVLGTGALVAGGLVAGGEVLGGDAGIDAGLVGVVVAAARWCVVDACGFCVVVGVDALEGGRPVLTEWPLPPHADAVIARAITNAVARNIFGSFNGSRLGRRASTIR